MVRVEQRVHAVNQRDAHVLLQRSRAARLAWHQPPSCSPPACSTCTLAWHAPACLQAQAAANCKRSQIPAPPTLHRRGWCSCTHRHTGELAGHVFFHQVVQLGGNLHARWATAHLHSGGATGGCQQSVSGEPTTKLTGNAVWRRRIAISAETIHLPAGQAGCCQGHELGRSRPHHHKGQQLAAALRRDIGQGGMLQRLAA